MTQYTAGADKILPSHTEARPLLVTRIYNLMIWDEMDRVQISEARYHTLSFMGFEGAPARTYVYTIDGKPATATEAYHLLRKAQTTGSVELVA